MTSAKQYETFGQACEKLDGFSSVDQKLTHALTFMRTALAEGDRPRFRDFWQMKKVCLELFKQEISRIKRVACWDEYTSLLSEAHALQKVHEEYLSFQEEQLLLAIKGLEEEWKRGPQKISEKKQAQLLSIDRDGNLAEMIGELDLIKKLREKAISLRKEILALEIRISRKNHLLKHLSEISDQIFPRWKYLLEETTKLFSEKVDVFYKKIVEQDKQLPLFKKFKQKIQAFQATLSELTLRNEIYRQLRRKLGECWNMVVTQENQLQMAYKKEVEGRNHKRATEEEVRQKQKKLFEESIEKLNELQAKAKQLKWEVLISQLEKVCQALPKRPLQAKERLIFTHKKELIEIEIVLKKWKEGNDCDVVHVYEQMKATKALLREQKEKCGLDITWAIELDGYLEEKKEALERLETQL